VGPEAEEAHASKKSARPKRKAGRLRRPDDMRQLVLAHGNAIAPEAECRKFALSECAYVPANQSSVLFWGL